MRLPLCLLFVSAALPAPAQTTKLNALRELSAAMEALSRSVSGGVVQIFSTGYAFNEESDATNTSSLIARQRSSGSGVIVSEDGYIVTNSHVVQSARRVQVQLSYGTTTLEAGTRVNRKARLIDAKVVGLDREADLAVIKIEMNALPHLSFSDSEKLKQGQIVLAVGNPFGLDNSVSMGIVSSIGRQIKADDPLSYIQTDASINPGNSGGPLLDTEGHVVGINTFIYTQSGGNEGIGFAIPSNLVKSVYAQIRKSGHVHRGEIGARVQSVTPELAQGLDLQQDFGVLISDVTPEGPAADAGLKVGDIILTVDSRPMQNARQFELDLYRRPVGDKIAMQLLRGTERTNATVEVEEREGDIHRLADMVTPEANTIARLGILGIAIDKQTAELLPDLRKKYGVVVAARSQNAPYSGTGSLQAGDVIYSLNNTPVATIEALKQVLDSLKEGDDAVVQIERDSKLMFLVLELQ